MLDEDAVLEHPDLGEVVLAADDHDAVDGLATGQELGLGDDRPAATGLTAFAAPLLLGFEPGRPLDGRRLVAAGPGLTDPGHGAGRVVALTGASPAATATATRGGGFGGILLLSAGRVAVGVGVR